ncbi:MAG: hypothetical protein KBS74_06100 [Clostridiales bacterium]|nr:hypothetical protein [Candidatus Cacconaster stercorequi]
MEKINSKKAMRIVLSILIAIAIWLYVDIEKAPEVATWVRDIPVEFSNENTVLADKGLMLLSGYDTTVDLKLKAPRKELFKLDDSSQIRIVADVSGINEVGVQSLTYQIYYPDNISRNSIHVEDASAFSITVTVGELNTKTIPVKCEVTGDVAKGYFAGTLKLDPEELVLRGQRDDLLNISYAKVKMDVSGVESTEIQTMEYVLYDYNDVMVTNNHIRADVNLIQATLPVTTMKEVPLKIQFKEATGSTLDQVKYNISPNTVKLSGERETLDKISEIVLDTIYLQDLQETQSLTYKIPVPDGIVLADDTDEAMVTIVVSGVTEKTFTVDRITCEKIPKGFDAELETTSLDVTLRGLTKELNKVKERDVQIIADLSGVTDEGLNTVAVSVKIPGVKDVGIKGKYQVIVNVTKTAAETTAKESNGDTTAADSETNTGKTEESTGEAVPETTESTPPDTETEN